MKVCEEAGLYCELDDGSVLGIWFLKIISWEPEVIILISLYGLKKSRFPRQLIVSKI